MCNRGIPLLHKFTRRYLYKMILLLEAIVAITIFIIIASVFLTFKALFSREWDMVALFLLSGLSSLINMVSQGFDIVAAVLTIIMFFIGVYLLFRNEDIKTQDWTSLTPNHKAIIATSSLIIIVSLIYYRNGDPGLKLSVVAIYISILLNYMEKGKMDTKNNVDDTINELKKEIIILREVIQHISSDQQNHGTNDLTD